MQGHEHKCVWVKAMLTIQVLWGIEFPCAWSLSRDKYCWISSPTPYVSPIAPIPTTVVWASSNKYLGLGPQLQHSSFVAQLVTPQSGQRSGRHAWSQSPDLLSPRTTSCISASHGKTFTSPIGTGLSHAFPSGIWSIYLFWKSSEVPAFSSHNSRECPHLVPVHPAQNIYGVVAKLLDPWILII